MSKRACVGVGGKAERTGGIKVAFQAYLVGTEQRTKGFSAPTPKNSNTAVVTEKS